MLSPTKNMFQNKACFIQLYFHNNLEPCCDWLELRDKVDITLILIHLQCHYVAIFLLPCTLVLRSLGVSVQGMNRQ